LSVLSRRSLFAPGDVPIYAGESSRVLTWVDVFDYAPNYQNQGLSPPVTPPSAGLPPVPPHCFNQPLFSEIFECFIECLCDAVGVQH
jgi:hypothetical protein